MLSSLLIENYAIIDKLEMSFKKGFSVITGETGAGKSIILGALGLVLGQRSDNKTIKEGANKCIIEAVFEIGSYQLKAFFSNNDIDYDENCIIRREVLSSGKSRSFINDTPVALSILKELSSELIDIHSQHESILLNNKNFQLNIVDTIANTEKELNEYVSTYNEYIKSSKELETLQELAKNSKTDKDYLQFQFEQLSSTNLQEDEKENLEDELKKLTHAEDIKTELDRISTLLSEENNGIITLLKDSNNAIQKISDYIDQGKDIHERLNSAYIDLKDLSSEIDILQNDITYDPGRIEFINQRLDKIYSLEQKHQVEGISALLEAQQSIEKKLLQIDSYDDEIQSLETKINAILKELKNKAQTLTLKRTNSAQKISRTIIPTLLSLGIKEAQFEVKISSKEDLSSSGKDNLQFLFSANKNATLRPVAEIASGGEISRLMLSIKSLIASTKELPSIIFDEIDTGISGETASKMGEIMSSMSQRTQVICITHLPQIAAKGNTHYKVHKDSGKTDIKLLSQNERTNEIALMLSGSNISEAAIENAKALLSEC